MLKLFCLGNWELLQTDCCSFLTYPILFFLSLLSTPVLSSTTGYSRLILCFLFPVLESPTSPRRLVLLAGGWCSETKVWVQGILIALRPSQQTEPGDTCLYPCIYFKMWASKVLHIHIVLGSFLSPFFKRKDFKTNFDRSLRIFIAYNLDEMISKRLQDKLQLSFLGSCLSTRSFSFTGYFINSAI